MAFTDFASQHWTQRFLPKKLRPYAALARLDRPAGTWLLLLPAWWSLVFAAQSTHAPLVELFSQGFLFGIGALLLRSFGCVINDFWDKDLDAQVERTKNRPLASGQLSPFSALVFAGMLGIFGFFILLCLNRLTILLGILFFPLILLYPLMKRWVPWPQVFLGITFNAGALMGWAALQATLSWPAFCLYGGAFFWTLAYDTLYAHQDQKDDQSLKIGSTAIFFGKHSRLWITIATVLAFFFVACAGFGAQMGVFFFIFLVGALCQGLWIAQKTDFSSQASCLKGFRSHVTLGKIIFLGALLERFLSLVN